MLLEPDLLLEPDSHLSNMSEWVYGVYAVKKREHRGSSLHVRCGV